MVPATVRFSSVYVGLPASCDIPITRPVWLINASYTATSHCSSSETILGCNIIQQVQKSTTFVKDHLACSSTLAQHLYIYCTTNNPFISYLHIVEIFMIIVHVFYIDINKLASIVTAKHLISDLAVCSTTGEEVRSKA